MTFDDLEVAIFSYNRLPYLKTCYDSVCRNMPGVRIRVFDDNSDDPDLVAYLDSLPAGTVCKPDQDSARARHGNLFPNMQRALDTAERGYLLMLMEDTQVIRPVDDQDLSDLQRIYDEDPDCAFISVTFLRGARIRRYRRVLVPDAKRRVYDTPCAPSEPGYENRIAYFDISLWNVARLRAKNWKVQDSEHGSILKARDMFSTMPHIAAPFVFHVPEVPVYRHRQQTLAARIARRVVGTDPKAFIDMTPEQVDAYRTRDLAQWPIAEDFLTTYDPKVRRPFVYKDVKRHWWLAALSKVEFKLRRLFR